MDAMDSALISPFVIVAGVLQAFDPPTSPQRTGW